MTRPAVSLIVTTYDRPDALDRVLESVVRQSRAPDEILIAEDGSDGATARVIDAFARRWGGRLEHIRQPHEGFRAGRIRNRAIALARSDYIVLVDGDMLLDPHFVADHRDAARPGWFMQGTRIRMDPKSTAAALAGTQDRLPGVLDSGIGGLRRVYAVRSRLASHTVRRLANSFIAVKSCNQGFWRSDLLRVNGFDEAMNGWGYEDKELCARLIHAGVRRGTLLFSAIAHHLHHPPASRADVALNRAIFERTISERRWRTDHGIAPP